jgi:putative oxidoreductase
MKIGRLAVRTVIGGLFVGHGLQKLTGDFDGPGIDGATQMMEKIGMRPARANAYAAGVTEAVGGGLFALGAATPLAGASLIGTMVTAIRKVHGKNGPWITKQGYEYNLVLIAAILGVIDGGPGALSIDRLRGKHETGLPTALFALGLGAATSAAVIEASRRRLEVEQPAASAPAPGTLIEPGPAPAPVPTDTAADPVIDVPSTPFRDTA